MSGSPMTRVLMMPVDSAERVVILGMSTEQDLEAFTLALDAALQVRSSCSAPKTAPSATYELGDNTTRPPPLVEAMRAMLKHLADRNCFEDRKGVVTDD